MYATAVKKPIGILFLLLLAMITACTSEKPVAGEHKKQAPTIIVKPRHPVLSSEQRSELGFPEDVIAKVELSAGADAEPFFTSVFVPSENLKGEKGFDKEKLTGFSVRTKKADKLITDYRAGLRVRGLLIFKSHRGYGSLPDIVTVVKGNNSYDLLKVQATEAANYKLDTKSIVVWLRKQQKICSFTVTGAGPDWIEAKFIRQPEDMNAFARKVMGFAPDVRVYGPKTADKLAERMKKTNGFYLVWD